MKESIITREEDKKSLELEQGRADEGMRGEGVKKLEQERSGKGVRS